MKKRLIALVLALVSVMGLAAGAATTYQNLQVQYGIRLIINGETPTLTDVNGKVVQPFVVEGTTYVPIRAVTDAIDGYVGYSNETNTAVIQSFGGESDMWTLFILSKMTAYTTAAQNIATSMALSSYPILPPAELTEKMAEYRSYLEDIDIYVQETQYYVDQVQPDEAYYTQINEMMDWMDNIPADLRHMMDCYEAWHRNVDDASSLNVSAAFSTLVLSFDEIFAGSVALDEELFSVFNDVRVEL